MSNGALSQAENDALLARDKRLLALDEAINYAVDYCIKHGILQDFFTALDEGDRMNILTEYARDLELQAVKEDGFEEGIERGIERGVETERGYVLGLIRQGLSAEEIGRRLAGVI